MEKIEIEEEKKDVPDSKDSQDSPDKDMSYGSQGDIHTVYAIKNGNFDIVDKKELDKKNYHYRLYSRVNGIAIIDYDKNDIIPITKDILNRQNTFLEIKILRMLIVICGLSLIGLVVIGLLVYDNEPPPFDDSKILTEMRAMEARAERVPIPLSDITPPNVTTTPKKDVGIIPEYPPDTSTGTTIINRKRNIPNYAD